MVNAEDGSGLVDRMPGLMGGAVGMGPVAWTDLAELGRDIPDLGRGNSPPRSSP